MEQLKAGYKQTELGIFPADWDVVLLGNHFQFKNGLNKAKEFFGFGTPIVNYMDVFQHPGLKLRDIEGQVDVNIRELSAYNVCQGDVFFTRTSETVDEIGVASVMVDSPEKTVFSGFVLRARPIDQSLDNQFKKYCFSTTYFRKQVTARASYTTRALTNGRFLSASLLVRPPISEQRAIAAALSDVDALLDSLDRLIAKKRNLKQASIQQLLTCRRRLPGFSGEWDVKRLGDIAEVATGNTPPTNDRSNYGNDYFFVSPADLGKGKWILDTEKKLSTKGYDLSRKFPRKSILFTCIGSTIGKSGISDRDLTSNQQINAIFPNNKYSTEYLYYELSSQFKKIQSLSCEQAVPLINKTEFCAILIAFPSLPEQTTIATVLSDMDAEIAALEKRRNKTRDIKQAMMQELLTGKTRLLSPIGCNV